MPTETSTPEPNATPIANVDPAARDLEGYLFPETYSLPPKTAAVTVEITCAGCSTLLSGGAPCPKAALTASISTTSRNKKQFALLEVLLNIIHSFLLTNNSLNRLSCANLCPGAQAVEEGEL